MEIVTATFGKIQKGMMVNKRGAVIKTTLRQANHYVNQVALSKKEVSENKKNKPHRWHIDGIRPMTHSEVKKWEDAQRPAVITIVTSAQSYSSAQNAENSQLKHQMAEMQAKMEEMARSMETNKAKTVATPSPETVKISEAIAEQEDNPNGITLDDIEAAGTNFQALKKMVNNAGIETDKRSVKSLREVLTNYVKGGSNE